MHIGGDRRIAQGIHLLAGPGNSHASIGDQRNEFRLGFKRFQPHIGIATPHEQAQSGTCLDLAAGCTCHKKCC